MESSSVYPPPRLIFWETTAGCNLTCRFCQNSEISQPADVSISAEDITAKRIIEITKENNLPGIAYTYTEPTIAMEFYIELMKLARKEGLYNVWVSNGYINPEPARKIARYMDAINVDLKGDVKFYQKLCGVPSEEPMKNALKIYRKAGVWTEVTNLVIPGYNDKPGQIESLVEWVMDNLGPETPMHFSRFYPHYKMTDVGPTPVETLETVTRIAGKAGMKWVYTGNVPGHGRENTKCPGCGAVLIERSGISVASFKDKCDKCKIRVPVSGKGWMIG